jgi:hypothetical protein
VREVKCGRQVSRGGAVAMTTYLFGGNDDGRRGGVLRLQRSVADIFSARILAAESRRYLVGVQCSKTRWVSLTAPVDPQNYVMAEGTEPTRQLADASRHNVYVMN